MLTYILKLPPLNHETALDGPYAIILAPTRELAQQIQEECSKLSFFCGVRSMSVVGGVCIIFFNFFYCS